MEYEYNSGPESPADLEWSQGAKNLRIKQGTLHSDTFKYPGLLEMESDEYLSDNDDDDELEEVADPSNFKNRNHNLELKNQNRPQYFNPACFGSAIMNVFPELELAIKNCENIPNKYTQYPFPSRYILEAFYKFNSQPLRRKQNKKLHRALLRFPRVLANLRTCQNLSKIVGPNPLEAVLVNEMCKTNRFNANVLKEITGNIIRKIEQSDTNSFVPKFENCQIIDRMCVITCSNEASLLWLQELDHSLLKNTGLILSGCWIGKQITVQCTFPVIPSFEVTDILTLLKKQNPELIVSQWHIVSWENTRIPFEKKVVLGIDESSLKQLKALAMRPFYGLSRVYFESIHCGTYNSYKHFQTIKPKKRKAHKKLAAPSNSIKSKKRKQSF